MTAHAASAERRRAGHSLWWATCPCGWSAPAAHKQDAEQRALIHNSIKRALALVEAEVTEDCYDPDSMEYGPDYPCLRCELRQLLGGVA